MRVEPEALIGRIGALSALDLRDTLDRSVQRLLHMVERLLDLDGAGLTLVDADGELRWAAASDQHAQLAGFRQEQRADGPCVRAFSERSPVVVSDVRLDGSRGIRGVLLEASFFAAASVPVELGGGAIGTLDAYASEPREWHEGEVNVLKASAVVMANLIGSVALAQVNGQLAKQLQTALDNRIVIEQAKGVLMERDGIDDRTAFERMREFARGARRSTADLAVDVIAGKPIPPSQVESHAEETRAAREAGKLAHERAATLHERIANMYERLGRPDLAKAERRRALRSRARADRARPNDASAEENGPSSGPSSPP